MSNINSFIALSDDFSITLNELKLEYRQFRFVDFIREVFLIDDAKSVVKEAYIAEATTKIIFLAAHSFNIYAQNSLLKILEEPPRNIVFILCVNSKSTLLPTVRSRLPIKIYAKRKELISSGLDFERLNAKDVYEFLQKNRFLSQRELENLIQVITKEAINSGINFNDKELSNIAKLLQLVSLNSKHVLSSLLSIILQKVSS